MLSLKKELDLKETQLLWESNKLMEAEANLHRAEQERAKMVTSVCRLNLKLTEAKEKENEGTDDDGGWSFTAREHKLADSWHVSYLKQNVQVEKLGISAGSRLIQVGFSL